MIELMSVLKDYVSLTINPETLALVWLIWKMHVRVKKIEDNEIYQKGKEAGENAAAHTVSS